MKLIFMFFAIVSTTVHAGEEVTTSKCGLFAMRKALEWAPKQMSAQEYQQKKVSIDLLDARLIDF